MKNINFYQRFDSNPPVVNNDITKFEIDAGFRLPKEYLDFLLWSNGGIGFIGTHTYINLWKIEELIEDNKGYNVAESAPGFFIFGSNGGGEAHAFDIRTPEMPIVNLPFIGMEPRVALPIARNFDEFIEILANRKL